MRLPPGLAGDRRCGDRNNEVRLRPRLAGERQTLRGFLLGQRVLEVIAPLVLAGFDAALASAAGAVAAVERDVDAGAVGGLGNGLVGIALNEARDAVLEVERDAVAHWFVSAARAAAPIALIVWPPLPSTILRWL